MLRLLFATVQRAGLPIVLATFVVALIVQWNGPQSIAVADEIAYVTGGVNLVTTGSYTNPFGEPELWFPPVYPVLIGSLSLGGLLNPFEVARVISALAAVLTLCIVHDLVRRALAANRVSVPAEEETADFPALYGTLASFLLACNPIFQHYATRALSESLATCLTLAALRLWVGSFSDATTRTLTRSVCVAVMIGLAALTRPECVLMLPLWCCFEVYRHRDRLAFSRSLIAALTLAVMLAPYVLFLHSHTGKWMLSNKGPVNLAAGRSAFHNSPREFIEPKNLVMGFYEYDTSAWVELQRYAFNASKLAAAFGEAYACWWMACIVGYIAIAGVLHLRRQSVSATVGKEKSPPPCLTRHLATALLLQFAYLGVVCIYDVGGPKNLHLVLPVIAIATTAGIVALFENQRRFTLGLASLALLLCVLEGGTRYPRWVLTSDTPQEQLLVDAGTTLATWLAEQSPSKPSVVYENGATVGFYAGQLRGRLTPNTLDTITQFVRKHETQRQVFLAVSNFNMVKMDPSVKALLETPSMDWSEVVRIQDGKGEVAIFQLRPVRPFEPSHAELDAVRTTQPNQLTQR